MKVSKFIGADLMNNLMKNLVENEAASEDVKTYVIADLVIELSRKMGNSVAEATSDFLQANIEYRPDRSGNDKDVFKSPAQLLKDGWGDCDDWFHFSYSVLQQAGVEQFALIIPKLPRSQVGHIANLYRGADRNFCVLDNSGIVCLNTNNAEEALKRYADSWRLGDEELDWKTIQLQEVSPSGSK